MKILPWVLAIAAGAVLYAGALVTACRPEAPATTAEAQPSPPRDPMAVTYVAEIQDGSNWRSKMRVYRVVDIEAGMVVYVTTGGSDSVSMSTVKISDTALGMKWVKPAGSGKWERER